MRYVLNKRTGTLHRLPASEACNTDDIADGRRFEVDDGEEVVGFIHRTFRFCKRCFRAVPRG